MTKLSKDYLVETSKALEIVERKIREFEHGPSRNDRIRLLKGYMKKATDFDEHKALKDEHDLLVFQEMKNMSEKPIPEDVKERILANYEIEMDELRTDLNSTYAELEKHFAVFEKAAKPLLTKLNAMHGKANSTLRLGGLLDIEYRASVTGDYIRSAFQAPLPLGLTKYYSPSMQKWLNEMSKLCGGPKA